MELLYAKKLLKIGQQWMKGEIIAINRQQLFDIVDIEYADGTVKQYKVKRV